MLRLIVWILILHCLVFPAVVVLNIVVSLTLALTSIIWMALFISAYYLFNTFLYRILYSEGMVFPLFRLLFGIFLNIFLLFVTALLVVLLPLLGLAKLLWHTFMYCLSGLWECFILLVIRCFGRTPAEDSCAATCIAGPGVSRNYFHSISEENTLILFMGHL